MHAARGEHTDRARHIINGGTRRERQLALRRVRDEVVEVGRVAARVGDVLEVRVEGRVEGEEVLVREREAQRGDLLLHEPPRE